MSKVLRLLFLFASLLAYNSSVGQSSINGTVENENGEPYVGAHVLLFPKGYSTSTDDQGRFEFADLEAAEYLLTITYLGTKNHSETVVLKGEDVQLQVLLKDDVLALQSVVVTGSFEPRSKLSSATSISTMETNGLGKGYFRGTADLLNSIPGTFTDASAGEVFTRVHSRGISASAEDDMGWYYVSLQEDGLPIGLVQHSYYAPDIFHRTDIFTARVEAIRGGSAAITAPNAPGGIYNFISKGPNDIFGGEVRLQGGLQGENNPMARIDGRVSGPLGKDWFYNVGGHYRKDEGARNTDFTFSKGGQLRFNLLKKHKKGFVKFYGKFLDDFTNRYTGVAATNWDDPVAAFGQDFNTTALLMPAFTANVPDGRNLDGGGTNLFDPSQGVHAQDKAFGAALLQDLGKEWSFSFNLKYSHKNANWQTSISNAYVSLNDPLAYFISGAQFPIGEVVFKDAVSGVEMARVDNSWILIGEPFQYVGSGTLPYDGIMGIAAWLKQNRSDEWMNNFTLRKVMEDHDLNFGMDFGRASTSLFTQGSFGFVTYEANPRMLQVTLENPDQPVLDLSDSNGLSNYGGLFFDNAQADIDQTAFFVNDLWEFSEHMQLDLGIRYEYIAHKGGKDQAIPYENEGGYDGNATTEYDNGILMSSGERDSFDFKYDYLSFSTALNYTVNEQMDVFSRFSSGNKAPEMNYYFNNFSGVPINQKGEVQKINQLELGFKGHTRQFSAIGTVFWSQLKNVGIADFQFDSEAGSVFYAPVQVNDTRTIGMEWESAYSPLLNLAFTFNGVVQNAKATKWTVYDAAGTVDMADDGILDYSDNELAFNPALRFNLGVNYHKERWSGFYKWQFMGERQGNVANTFQLPAYSIFNMGIGVEIIENLSANLEVTNLFNSAGLANFAGPNSFGASANSATAAYIQANPDASFIVFPVLPRGSYLTLDYKF
ncbi:TonB-dependent receptor [Maribacter polysaccharolyticus]|uniref:TonB-dependent receptor n=1 Tax=Maribacter polysaccharolyticus TaxID=3020831 RepID=UPI00237FAAFA|nr:TonB-dependent receptor [Maribacter polysaccharolyticus]MDE3740858.1 TonB-dependent receptor [Maribacter polysaccharolyticus]